VTKYWRRHYTRCPQTNYWGTCPAVPSGFGTWLSMLMQL